MVTRFKTLPFAVMRRVARVRQRQMSYLFTRATVAQYLLSSRVLAMELVL